MVPFKMLTGFSKEVYKSPFGLALTFVITILIVELGLMLALKFMPPLPAFAEALIDGILLVILIVPVLYFVIFRPMDRYIAERNRAEESLALLNKQSQLILNSAVEGIMGLDLQGRHTFFNLAASRMLGYTAEELAGRNSHDIWHHSKPDGSPYPEKECPIYTTIQQGVVHSVSNEDFWRKDGTCFPVSYSSTPIIEDSGILGAVITFTDITERKRVEREWQLQAEIVHSVTITANLTEMLKLIHQSLSKVIYAENCFFALYDPGTGLYNFPYYVDKFETTPEPEPMPRSCTAYVFRTGKSLVMTPKLFQQLKEQNEVELLGSPSPSWIGVPLQTSSGIIGVLVLQNYEEENVYSEDNLKFLDSIASQVANVVERKRAEEDLKRSNSLLTATLESTADGILVVDKNGKITNYNEKFIELWQIPDSIIATHNDEDLISFVLNQLKEPDSFLEKVREMYTNDEIKSYDILEFNDGRTFERYSQSQLFEGGSVGRVWSFRDITKRVQAVDEINKLADELEQKVMERTAQLGRAYQELEAFSYSASHEIRTPLRALDGFANILLQDYSESLDAEGKRMLNIIIENANKMGHLIDDLLSYSGLGRKEMLFSNIDMRAMAKECYHKLTSEMYKDGIEFRLTDIPESQGDQSMIRLVWMNLLGNAIKFTSHKQNRLIEVGNSSEDGNIIYYVKDNGIGFDMNLSNQLFGIFKRLPGARSFKGIGGGLAIVQRIILNHNGRIWAEGKVNEGAIFYFTIGE